MMIFVPGEIVDEMVEDCDDPHAELAKFMRSELKLPVVAEDGGIRATRGRLAIKHLNYGDLRVLYHEIH